MGLGFIMIRKKGKLPGKILSKSYALEYGEDVIEMQEGLVKPGCRAVLCDDLLATGGTAGAAVSLARQAGIDVVHGAFVIELAFLEGRKRVDIPISSLVSYDS